MKINKAILKHTGTYLFFDIINKAIPFLFLPYLTHMLSVVDLGNLELFNTYVGLLTLLILFGLDGWCASMYNGLERNEFSRKLILGIKISAIISLIAFFILILLNQSLWLAIAPIYAFSMCIIQIRTLTFRLQLKTVTASIILFLNISLSVLLTIGAFTFNEKNLTNRLIALLLPALMLCLWSLRSLLKEFKSDATISKHEFSTFIRFTIPLLPNGLMNFVRFGADRFYVAHFFGVSSLALFGVSYQFAMIANIFMLSLNQAIMPFTMRLLNENKIRQFLKFTLSVVLFFTFVIVILSIATPYILNVFFDSRYISAQYMSRIYFFSYPLVFLSILLMNIAFIRGRTKLILLMTSISSLTHLTFLWCILNTNSALFNVPYALMISSIVSVILSILTFSRLTRDA
ncbi:oligosaccharide flippase family protein [Enterobacter sp. ECC-175]|uniref:lipopolysaccharide biosynthesis protein n=1 Tax=unclassified Enterobacter TaxID=2608935 RepID=UPI0015EB426C|nr:oligosaccharide flippase family protein [Enterobacter sp. RIT 418]